MANYSKNKTTIGTIKKIVYLQFICIHYVRKIVKSYSQSGSKLIESSSQKLKIVRNFHCRQKQNLSI